jgi:2-polyprenyl-3-methyl-5-hydroxy-6-metoxy-1,4-benzoquinol methylase
MKNSFFETREKCPACDSERLTIIYQRPYDKPPIREYLQEFYSPQGKVEIEYLVGANYILCECVRCGLIFQKDIPNSTLTKRLYDIWIDPEKAFQRQKQKGLDYYSSCAQEIMRIISFLDKPPASLTFLDFGMGWGEWALMAKAFGCDSYGTELSETRVEHARINGLVVISGDEIPKYRFDFINTEQVFEHIPNPLGTLRHLKEGLKPNGVIKVSVPTGRGVERRLQVMDWKAPKGTNNSLNPVAPLEHINYFRRRSLIKMANEVGMELISIPLRLQYKYTANWDGIRQIARNILLPIYRNILKRQNYLFFRVP